MSIIIHKRNIIIIFQLLLHRINALCKELLGSEKPRVSDEVLSDGPEVTCEGGKHHAQESVTASKEEECMILHISFSVHPIDPAENHNIS